jgi:hypothetical protein
MAALLFSRTVQSWPLTLPDQDQPDRGERCTIAGPLNLVDHEARPWPCDGARSLADPEQTDRKSDQAQNHQRSAHHMSLPSPGPPGRHRRPGPRAYMKVSSPDNRSWRQVGIPAAHLLSWKSQVGHGSSFLRPRFRVRTNSRRALRELQIGGVAKNGARVLELLPGASDHDMCKFRPGLRPRKNVGNIISEDFDFFGNPHCDPLDLLCLTYVKAAAECR